MTDLSVDKQVRLGGTRIDDEEQDQHCLDQKCNEEDLEEEVKRSNKDHILRS